MVYGNKRGILVDFKHKNQEAVAGIGQQSLRKIVKKKKKPSDKRNACLQGGWGGGQLQHLL